MWHYWVERDGSMQMGTHYGPYSVVLPRSEWVRVSLMKKPTRKGWATKARRKALKAKAKG